MNCLWTIFLASCLLGVIWAQDTTDQPLPSTSEPPVDVKTVATWIGTRMRDLAARAKPGMLLKRLSSEIIDISNNASAALVLLNMSVSECDVNLVIKTSVAVVGSHESLALILAKDSIQIYNAQVALSLALWEKTAQALEDKLAQSDDVGPELGAVVFSSKATVDNILSADAALTSLPKLTGSAGPYGRPAHRVHLGNGFTMTPAGNAWASSRGTARWRLVRPDRRGRSLALKREDFGYDWTSPSGDTNVNVGGNYDSPDHWGVNARLNYSSPGGNSNLNLGGSANSAGQWGFNANFNFKF